MILCQFPTLELATIHKVIAFYLENQVDIDRYVVEYEAELGSTSQCRPQRAKRS